MSNRENNPDKNRVKHPLDIPLPSDMKGLRGYSVYLRTMLDGDRFTQKVYDLSYKLKAYHGVYWLLKYFNT